MRSLFNDFFGFVKENKYFILAYVILASYLAHFYITDGITMGKDGGAFFLANSASVINERFSLWNENVHGMHNVYEYMYSPVYFLLSLAKIFGIAGPAFAYWWLSFFIALIGLFLLCNKIIELFGLEIKNKKIACLLVSFAYLLSPIAVVARWGDMNSQSMVYGVFPLFVYFILDIFFEAKFRRALGKTLIYSAIMSILSFGLVNVGLLLVPLATMIFKYEKLDIKKTALLGFVLALMFSWAIIGFLSDTLSSQWEGNSADDISWRAEWGYNYYANFVDEFSVLSFYPIKLHGYIEAYDAYYLKPEVLITWNLLVLLMLLSTLLAGRKNPRYAAYCIVLFIFASSLSMLPKGLLAPVYDLFINSGFLWQLKTAYDRFNFILQFSLILIALNYVSIFLNQKSTIVKSAGIGFLAVALIISGAPLLNGESSDDKGSGTWKATPNAVVVEFLDYVEEIGSSDSWILYVPGVRGSWIEAKWYRGLDYIAHLPGKSTGYCMDCSGITEEIGGLLSSGDLMFDDTKQTRLMKLLSLGNYKYIIIRGDMNLTNQPHWPGNPDVRNQVMNARFLVDEHNFTEVFSNGEMCSQLALLKEGVPTIEVEGSGQNLQAEVIFRRLERKSTEVPFIRIKTLDKEINYYHSNGRFLMVDGEWYWTSDMPGNDDINWHNVTIATGEELQIFVDGYRINISDEEIPGSDDFRTKHISSILLSKIKIKDCGSDGCRLLEETDYDKQLGTVFAEGELIETDCPSEEFLGYGIYENRHTYGNIISIDDSGNIGSVEYEEINPAEYIVKNADLGKRIVVSESFDSRWEARAYKDNVEISRMKSEWYENLVSFRFNDELDYERIVIIYTPQELADIGFYCSALTALVGLLLIWKIPEDHKF